jgi:dTDP-4-amino-4,6-dideoxygalactose transaminase
MKISFLDLQKLNLPHQQLIQENVSQQIASGWYILGKNLEQFEQSFAAYIGVKHCIGVGNGLDALALLLKAHHFPKKSEVIVAANTYIATILAITQAGLIPILVEPNPETYQINEGKIEEKITKNTRAILVTHLYGRCAEMQAIWDLASKYKLKIFEDAAQAHGATYQTKKAGNLSDGAGFSFYPTKNLGAMGDGGAITTNDDDLANKLRKLRNYGFSVKNVADFKGHNSRLDEIQAVILQTKLPFLDSENKSRREIAKRYLSEIKNPAIILPPANRIEEDVWHLFVIQHENRDELREKLSQKGIETAIHYPFPPHQQKAYSELNHLSLPITERLHNQVLSLPNAPYLTEQEINYIIATLNEL